METTHNPTVWIGVDVSKETLDACLIRNEGKPLSKTFPNTSAGHQKLLRWSQHLAGEAVYHVAMEWF